MTSMTMNLVKRVERLPKPKRTSDALLPLFEAVNNSVQSTREKYKSQVAKKGRVIITIENIRSTAKLKIFVEDNGTGLDQKNFAAFRETDTDNKIEIGGKGVGRLLWLDCFKKIHIASYFKVEAAINFREFDFALTQENQLKNLKEKTATPKSVDTGVTIAFEGLRENSYREKFPNRAAYVIQHFTSHFLSTFVGGKCPTVTLSIDGQVGNFPEDINAVILRREDIKNVSSLTLGVFDITLMECDKVASSDLKGTHFIHFVAHDRTVISHPIDAKLGFKVFGDEDRSVFHACIFGKYLDMHVNQERTGFTFPDAILDEIVNDVCMPKVEEFLAAPLKEHKEKQAGIVDEIVASYPSVGFGDTEELQNYIPLGELSEDAIFGHLSRQRFRRDVKQSEKIREILDKVRGGNVSGEAFFAAVRDASLAIEDAEKKSLAEYIVRRKVVLDFLEVLIRKVRDDSRDSSYQSENVLHSFICPLKISALERADKKVDVSSHDLWIVDERLTFAQYFASDVPFEELASSFTTKDRADLIIFDRVHGLRDSPQSSKILLIEFKRPGRTQYSENENPHQQVERYIKTLMMGGKTDVAGRPIHINDQTIFYCFIVADRIGRMADWTYSWSETADGRGRIYQPQSGYKGSIELIEWGSLIEDARERNRAFFDRAGIKDKNFFSNT